MFSFEIDKETCFWYWIQSLVKWSWYFEKGEFNFYKEKLGDSFYKKEKHLSKLEEMLKDPRNGFVWLWDRYTHKPIKSEEDYIYSYIKKTFESEFDVFWKEEVILLENWLKVLENFDSSTLQDFYRKVSVFLGKELEENKVITVKLLTYGNENFPAGHSHEIFNDVILLNISHLNKNLIEKAVGTLVHEHIHILVKESTKLNKYLRKSFEEKISSTSIQRSGPGWKHLLLETIITSIAGKRNENYLNHILWKNKFSNPLDGITDLEEERTNYGFLIRVAAFHILNETINYLDDPREINQLYCNKVAEIWLDIKKQTSF